MSNLQKSYNNDLHMELLMRFVVMRIANDIDYLEKKISNLEEKINKPKKSIFNLDMIDQNSKNSSIAELYQKNNLLERLMETLENNKIEVKDVDLSRKIAKLFENDPNGALRYSFLLQVIEFPIYASIDKKYSKENSKDLSFERVSTLLGYENSFALKTEKNIYQTLSDITDLNISKIILQTAIPLLAVSLLLPFAIEIFAGAGLFGGAVFTKGLATLGGTIIGGLSVLSIADILIGTAVVSGTIEYKKNKSKKMSLLNEDVLKAEGTNLILMFEYLNNLSDELSIIQKTNLVKDFLISKNSYEESNILETNSDSKEEVISKIRVANNISKKIIEINKI